MEIVSLVLSLFVLLALGAVLFVLLRPKPQQQDLFQKHVLDQLEQTRQAGEMSSSRVMSQVQAFTQGMTEVNVVVEQVQQRVKDVANFQDIFKSPKLRGIWGEASLESALAQYFPADRYAIQHYFKSGEAVDAVLKLPNDLILPIDSKFNWENFEKKANADTEVARDGFRKQFLSDVKKKIDEIAAKYLLPAEGTTDFALMYMPAETLYYEIIQNIKEADLSSYARAKKVILVSPNTFFLTVSAILHWFNDVQFSKQTRDIMKRLGRVVQDAGKLADDFRVLGKHLGNAQSAFDDTDKRLGLLVERTQKVIEMSEEVKEIE
ncbi:MAG: DNA recombination protein RmuC [Patescibacteria group bacterium]